MHRLEAMAHVPEGVAYGRMDRQKPPCLPGRLEAAHVAFPPPAVLVRHLGPVVLVPSGSMGCRQAEVSLGDCIDSQIVGNQLPCRSFQPLQELAGEALGGSRVPTARRWHQDIQDIAILVHRSPGIAALPADIEEDLIHMPGIAQPTLPTAQTAGKRETWPEAPQADRLAGHDHAALDEQVLHAAKLWVDR